MKDANMTTHPFKCAACGWRPANIQETLAPCQQCGRADGYEAACAVAGCDATAADLVETQDGRQWRCKGHAKGQHNQETKETTR